MGCGVPSNELKLMEKIVTNHVEYLNIQRLDEVFHKLSLRIKDVEEARKTIQDRRDDLLLRTGGCELKNPQLHKIFIAGLWKISADYKGVFELSGLQVMNKSPFLKLSCREITHDSLLIFLEIRNYIRSVSLLNESFQKTVSEINNLRDGIEEILKKNEFHSVDKNKLNYNINKLNNIYTLVNDMKKLLSESIVEINKFYNFLKDKNKRKTISDKGFIAYKKSITDVFEICWNLTEDEKYENCLEGKKIITEKIKMREECVEEL